MEGKTASHAAILEILDKDNYVDWSIRVKTYLMGQDLWDIVEATIEPPKQEDGAAFKVWSKKNHLALHVIQNSCGTDIFYEIRKIVSAKIAWDTLAEMYNVPKDTKPVVSEVLGKDNYEDWSAQVKSYLKAYDLWDAVEVIVEPPPKQEDDQDHDAFKAWNKKNYMALSVIKNSCGSDTFSQIREITSAKIAWDTLAEKYSAGTNDVSVDADDGYLMYGNLCKALRSGNWTAAKEFLERPPNAVGARITHRGETALHIAVAAGHFRVVDELVKLMPEQNLETLDSDGLSALTHAAVDGKIAMAQCMLRKNEKLINIPSSSGDLPVYTAISFGHIETARYLYSLTPPEDLMPERSYNGANLFIDAISAGTLDIALDLLQRCPRLTLAEDRYGNHPLVALASAPHLFPSGSRLVFWKRWIYKYSSSSSGLLMWFDDADERNQWKGSHRQTHSVKYAYRLIPSIKAIIDSH